jgi:hypothetical protein
MLRTHVADLQISAVRPFPAAIMTYKLFRMSNRRKPKRRSGASTRPDPAARAAGEASAAQRNRRLLAIVVWAALLLVIATGLALHIIHLVRRAPNYDEAVYLHFTWLTAQGVVPRDGFLCPYPPTAFYLFAPLLKLIPQVPETLIALRGGTLLFLAAYITSICVMARSLGRHVGIAAAYAVLFVGSGRFPSLWEFRYDLVAWSMAFAAMAMLLRSDRRRVLAVASGLTALSVMISPKHAFFAGGFAIAVAALRMPSGWRAFGRDILAALGGAAAPVALLSLIRPAFLLDVFDLTLMNYLTQLQTEYKVSLFDSLGLLFAQDFLAFSPAWAGSVLFILQAREHGRKVALLFGGALAGCIATVWSLPCGYEQYVALTWAVFAVFIPWMTPRSDRTWLKLVVALGLLGLSAFYIRENLPLMRQKSPMAAHLRLQRELARLCPPGEVSVSRPFAQAWFRGTPGYVYVDNNPSYRNFVNEDKKRHFTTEYFYDVLVRKPPAYVCWFTAADGQPPEYNEACRRFLADHADQYITMGIPCELHRMLDNQTLPVEVRRDIATNAVRAVPYQPRMGAVL